MGSRFRHTALGDVMEFRNPGRSWLFVPGNNPKFLTKSRSCGADVLLLDIEDGVPPNDKETARRMVADELDEPGPAPVRFVRVNSWQSGLTDSDLATVVRAGVGGICLPKAEDAASVTRLAAALDDLEHERGLPPAGIKILAAIESAFALRNAYEIALASPRVVGLILGAEDLALDMGLFTNRKEEASDLLYARSSLVNATTAAKVMSVDGVYPHLHDPDGLVADAQRTVNLGFTGKSTFSPRQIDLIHEAFKPSTEELSFSARAVEEFERAERESVGSVVVDGQLIDLPIVMRARTVLARGELA
ncbi:CoA ester lyase [Kribbella turkmenica]|uniref:CoA ester lyase n=1 Tax=Kribbella turkmenica TaxID=2530375 RepID=A0A4R4XBI4_9ACTN|nr:CoA ester lyase [Kribbella turkmenica]TDD27895.1 CoA ester lyase [Kribbella turkmenica]